VIIADPVSPPAVVNHPATGITYGSATLHGEVTDTVGEDPTVTIYWGDDDAGTTAANWDNQIDLGTRSQGAFDSDVTGLSYGTTYYFRCYAENSAGGSWAPSTESFDTSASPAAPSIANRPATNVASGSATLNGEVTDAGGEPPTVSIYWGESDGGTAAAGWDHVEDLGVRSGLFAKGISGLSFETTYYFRAYAENSAGGSWAPSTASFTTPSTSGETGFGCTGGEACALGMALALAALWAARR
jgi:hypothetical protein